MGPVRMVWQLAWPFSIRSMTGCAAKTPKWKSVLKAVGLPITRTQWRIDPNGARDEVVTHIANDLGLAILGDTDPEPTDPEPTRVRSKAGSTGATTSAWPCSTSPTGTWRSRRCTGSTTSVAPTWRSSRCGCPRRSRRSTSTVPVTSTRSSSGRPVSPGDVGPTLVMPADRLVFYSHEREGGLWQGQSMLRSAYKNWMIKDRLLRVDAMRHERNGMGVPIVETPPSASPALMAEANRLAQQYRAGDASGGDAGRHETHTRPVTRTLRHPLVGQVPRRADRPRSPRLSSSSSSPAPRVPGAREQPDRLLHPRPQALSRTSTPTPPTSRSSNPLVDVNWGEDGPAPKVVCAEIGNEHEATAEAVAALVDSVPSNPTRPLTPGCVRTTGCRNARHPWTPPARQEPAAPTAAQRPAEARRGEPTGKSGNPAGPAQRRAAGGPFKYAEALTVPLRDHYPARAHRFGLSQPEEDRD